jgi:hypothetical protein
LRLRRGRARKRAKPSLAWQGQRSRVIRTLAHELFTADHTMHDLRVPIPTGPDGMVQVISTYQKGVNGHWGIQEIAETWEVWDTRGFLQQLGVIPQPGQQASV